MKPVSVTVGMPSDDDDEVAIEACFEPSVRCNPEQRTLSLSKSEDDPILLERQNNSIMSKTFSSDTNNGQIHLRKTDEEIRDNTSTRDERMFLPQSDVRDTHLDESFIEAEFEMVLENARLPWENSLAEYADDQNLPSKISPSSDDGIVPVELEGSDEKQEEKVVVEASDDDETSRAKLVTSHDDEEAKVVTAASDEYENLLAKFEAFQQVSNDAEEENVVIVASDDYENLLAKFEAFHEASHDDDEEKVVVWSADADAQGVSRSIDSELEEVQDTTKEEISPVEARDISCKSDSEQNKSDPGHSHDVDYVVESPPGISSQTPELSIDEKLLIKPEPEARDGNVITLVEDVVHDHSVVDDTLHHGQCHDDDNHREQSSVQNSSHAADASAIETTAVDPGRVGEDQKEIEIVEEIPRGYGASFLVSLSKTFGWTIEANDSGLAPAIECQSNFTCSMNDEDAVAAEMATHSQDVGNNPTTEGGDVTATSGNVASCADDDIVIREPQKECDLNGAESGENEPGPDSNNKVDGELTAASVESVTPHDDEPHRENERKQDVNDAVDIVTSDLNMQTHPGNEARVVTPMKPVPLSTLINQRNWVSVMERMRSISVLSLNSAKIQGQAVFSDNDSLGDYLLHEICKNKPSAEVIQQWLKVKRDDVEKPGISGHLPLHYACWFGASIGAVDALVEAFPEALTKPDDHDKMLPLHYACREGADASVLEFLLMAYPEATLVQDKNGMTPMDHAMNLQDHNVRIQTVNCIQNGLKQNLSTLSAFIAKSKAETLEEQEIVKRLEMDLEATNKQAQEDHSKLECALAKVEALEKSESDKTAEIDNLRQKIEALESQVTQTHLLLAIEKKRVAAEKTRELESVLKIEQCKNSALEQSLNAKQEMLVNEKERTKDAEQKLAEISTLLQNEQETTKRLGEQLSLEQEKLQCLEQEQANRLAEEKQHARDNIGDCKRPDPSLAEEIKAEYDQKLELESIRREIEAKMEENHTAINALEISNSKKQELLDVQQEKVECLERVHREKELLLQKSQEIMKLLEESIEKKLSLQKTEEKEIRQLEQLRQKKREMIESEEELVRKLDYTLGRKQALLELEQMKEKTLQQTIARKNALLEAETNKVKELENICAEREALLASEQNMVKSLSASKAEKEDLLNAERALVDDLYRVHSEKEALLEMKRKTEEEMTKRVKHLELLLANEKKLLEEIERVRDERQASLVTTENALKAIEERTIKKSQLLNKEQDITECLERFRQRRNQLVSSGRVYSFMDATLCLSHLVKEAFLANQHDKRLLEAKQQKENVIVPKSSPPAPTTLLRKAISTQGKRYISHFAGYLGISPTIRRKYFR